MERSLANAELARSWLGSWLSFTKTELESYEPENLEFDPYFYTEEEKEEPSRQKFKADSSTRLDPVVCSAADKLHVSSSVDVKRCGMEWIEYIDSFSDELCKEDSAYSCVDSLLDDPPTENKAMWKGKDIWHHDFEVVDKYKPLELKPLAYGGEIMSALQVLRPKFSHFVVFPHSYSVAHKLKGRKVTFLYDTDKIPDIRLYENHCFVSVKDYRRIDDSDEVCLITGYHLHEQENKREIEIRLSKLLALGRHHPHHYYYAPVINTENTDSQFQILEIQDGETKENYKRLTISRVDGKIYKHRLINLTDVENYLFTKNVHLVSVPLSGHVGNHYQLWQFVTHEPVMERIYFMPRTIEMITDPLVNYTEKSYQLLPMTRVDLPCSKTGRWYAAEYEVGLRFVGYLQSREQNTCVLHYEDGTRQRIKCDSTLWVHGNIQRIFGLQIDVSGRHALVDILVPGESFDRRLVKHQELCASLGFDLIGWKHITNLNCHVLEKNEDLIIADPVSKSSRFFTIQQRPQIVVDRDLAREFDIEGEMDVSNYVCEWDKENKLFMISQITTKKMKSKETDVRRAKRQISKAEFLNSFFPYAIMPTLDRITIPDIPGTLDELVILPNLRDTLVSTFPYPLEIKTDEQNYLEILKYRQLIHLSRAIENHEQNLSDLITFLTKMAEAEVKRKTDGGDENGTKGKKKRGKEIDNDHG